MAEVKYSFISVKMQKTSLPKSMLFLNPHENEQVNIVDAYENGCEFRAHLFCALQVQIRQEDVLSCSFILPIAFALVSRVFCVGQCMYAYVDIYVHALVHNLFTLEETLMFSQFILKTVCCKINVIMQFHCKCYVTT